jgi:hypothetical protein
MVRLRQDCGTIANRATVGYDVSNVANIQASVYESFGHIELLPWVALSYTMGAVAVTPMVRRVVETFDTKVLYITFYMLFIVACTVSGSATNIHSLIVGRALMGLSYTGVYQMCVLLIIFRLVFTCIRSDHLRIQESQSCFSFCECSRCGTHCWNGGHVLGTWDYRRPIHQRWVGRKFSYNMAMG